MTSFHMTTGILLSLDRYALTNQSFKEGSGSIISIFRSCTQINWKTVLFETRKVIYSINRNLSQSVMRLVYIKMYV